MSTDDLLPTLSRLWPAAQVRRTRSRRLRRPGGRLLAEYALAPGAEHPRMAVPVGSAAVTAAGLSRFHAGLGVRERLSRTAAAGAGRVLGARLLPERVQVSGRAEGSLAGYLSELLGEPVRLFVGVGSARVNRKPVVGVVDRRGRTIAFAKVGLGPVAAVDVTAEGYALTRLGEVGWDRVRVPELVAAASWSGHPVVVATALPTSSRQPARWGRWAPEQVVTEIAAAFAEPDRAFVDLDWFARLGSEFAGLVDPTLRRAAVECHRALAAQPVDVPVGAWHGDLTPWNMAAHRGRVGVWDWERFETSVPLGMDALHHHLNAVTVRRGSEPETVLQALGEVPVPAPQLVGLYLAAVSARYLVLAQGPGGERIAARGSAFLQAWQRWTEQRSSTHRGAMTSLDVTAPR